MANLDLISFEYHAESFNTPDFRLQNKCCEFSTTNSNGYFIVKLIIFKGGLKDT